MKRIFLALIGFLALSLGPGFRAYSAEIQNMDPPFWWVGMKNTTLQVMLHGPNIAENEISVKYAGVSVKDVVKTTNPNYLFLYLDVTSKAKPGKMMITLSGKDGKTEHPFELKARSKKPGAQGFTTEDVLYLITPDRFADGNPDNNNLEGARTDRSRSGGRHGGDIKGVVDHLDYIEDLGITAIWLNPVQKNSAGTYHGYAITDYYDIDPRFGTMEEYIDFVDKAHARGMKVVMDMIFNHCGSGHWWMQEAQLQQQVRRHEPQQVDGRRSPRGPVRAQALHRRLVQPGHARPEPEQSAGRRLPDPKLHLVDRIRPHRRRPPGYASVHGSALRLPLVQGNDGRISGLQYHR